MKLRGFDLHLLKLPLKVPYHLAFADLTHFDTIVVEARDDQGRVGYGEATLLAAIKRRFAAVRHAKPPASRAVSAEVYLVAKGFGGRGAGDGKRRQSRLAGD